MSDSFDKVMQSEYEEASAPNILLRTIRIIQNDSQLIGAFGYNVFTNQIEHLQDNIILSPLAKKGGLLNDHDLSALRSYLAKKYNFRASKENLFDAMLDVAFCCKYHPVKDYLEKLKWDGVDRLNRWLTEICGAEDNAYTQAVGRKIFVAAVGRIYEPGCYFAQLPILEGKQRIFKSRLVKEMGGEWYASIHLKTQDTKTIIEEMRGKWFLEIEELAGFGRQETEYMKAFISRQSDRARLAYERLAMDYPRQSIMIATMNPDLGENRYLNDQTGNVRYWPVSCGEGKIKIDAFIDIRDQLFAEAMELYRRKESTWLTTEAEEEIATRFQEERLGEDPWMEYIMEWIAKRERENINFEVKTKDIAEDCLKMAPDKVTSGVLRRIARVLKKHGYVHKFSTSGMRYKYFVKSPDGEVESAWEE